MSSLKPVFYILKNAMALTLVKNLNSLREQDPTNLEDYVKFDSKKFKGWFMWYMDMYLGIFDIPTSKEKWFVRQFFFKFGYCVWSLMSLKLDDLPPRVSELLYRAVLVTTSAILDASECELLSLGTLTASDVKQIIRLAAQQAQLKGFIPGAQLTNRGGGRWGCLSTGCATLDQLLGGGLVTRGVSELAGHSGAGKTQLCLQLALTCQLPHNNGGLNAGAVFICTEDKFPSVRLNELTKTFPAAKKFSNLKFGNNIFVEHIADAVELQQCVDTRLPQLLRQHSIGLVVVDSIAAIYRADYSQAEMIQRARDLRVLACQLHSLANKHHIAVVCINQVSDVRRGEQSVTVPALGLAWANLVTCRLQMFRNNDLRRLQVVFAPHLPQGHCQYNITAAGVQGLSPVVYS